MATQSTWRSQTTGGPKWATKSQQHSNNTNINSSNANNGTANSSHHGNAFPPLGTKGSTMDEYDSTQRDRMLYLLVGLVGNTVLITTRSGIKYLGILSSTSAPSPNESLGVVLSSAQQILSSDAGQQEQKLGQLKKILIIKGDDLDSLVSHDVGMDVPVSMARNDRAGFRTDTEISKIGTDGLAGGRTLQKWTAGDDMMPLEATGGSADGGLAETKSGDWDQFAANEARFGIKSNYEETLYTTKLDKTTRDYKERERRADQLAKEIMSSSTNNVHIAEERDLIPEGEAVTEEDRYGAVVRGPNAYVPPAARRAAAAAAAVSSGKANGDKKEAAEKGTLKPKKAEDEQTGSPSPAAPSATPMLTTDESGAPSEETRKRVSQQNAFTDFKVFVEQERGRAERRKAAYVKKEMDNTLTALKSWGDAFKLKTPMPNDIASVTHRENETKASDRDSSIRATEKPRDPNLQKSLSPTTAHQQDKAKPSLTLNDKAGSQAGSSTNAAIRLTGSSSVAPSPTGGAGSAAAKIPSTSNAPKGRPSEATTSFAKMTIPKIPPFNPDRVKARQSAAAAVTATPSKSTEAPAAEDVPAVAGASEASTSKGKMKLSAKASAFKPFNPNATAFTPSTGTANVSPVPKKAESPSSAASPASGVAGATPPGPTQPAHPFFGHRVIKKPTSTATHVREDFNPFRASKVPDAQTIGPMWSFTGKPYRQLFHAIPPSAHGMPGPSSMADDGSVSSTPHMTHQHAGAHHGSGSSQTPIHTHAPLPHGPPHGQPQHMVQPHQAPHHMPAHSMGIPPGMQLPQGPPGQAQGPAQAQAQAGPQGQGGQPYGMMYQPYSPYRFHGQQPMVQGVGMPPQGGPMPPYGGMPPQFMGQMPFSPPMPPHGGGPPNMYSPQMGNMVPPGAPHGQYVNQGPSGPGNAQPGGPQGQPPRPSMPAPPQMHGKMPPHMYYQPMPAMPYGGPPGPGGGPSASQPPPPSQHPGVGLGSHQGGINGHNSSSSSVSASTNPPAQRSSSTASSAQNSQSHTHSHAPSTTTSTSNHSAKSNSTQAGSKPQKEG